MPASVRMHRPLLASVCCLFIGLITTALGFSTTNDANVINAPPRRQEATTQRSGDLPAPPCPRSNPSDDLFRSIRNSWPVWLQNSLRESGLLRTMEDTLILLAVPELLKQHPSTLEKFFDLSSRTSQIRYGSHGMQYLDLIEPNNENSASNDRRGVVAFVHGGAWGSGKPWMYRLAALPFLKANLAVAILGYRTYPDANVHGQVEDIGSALNALAEERPDLLDDEGRVDSLIGHSSGAHIGLLHVLESAMSASLLESRRQDDNVDDANEATANPKPTITQIGRFVGLSGVYCINSHFAYEAGRGVEQLSSLRAANGPDEAGFREASPAYRLECFVDANGNVEECALLDGNDDNNAGDQGGESGSSAPMQQVLMDDHVPEMLFVHGINDDVVQYNQTNVVVDAIQSYLVNPERCNEILLEDVGHADTVLHLMFGGVTSDVVLGGQRVGKET